MKKIIIIILLIWLVYLVYLNFFYKGSKMLCAMGLPAASAMVLAFIIGLFWIGLLFSYILKHLFDKIGKLLFSKAKREEKKEDKSLALLFNVFKFVLFIVALPLVFGLLIFFRIVPLNKFFFSKNYLFFILQLLGLIYIYFASLGRFNKFFGVSFKKSPQNY